MALRKRKQAEAGDGSYAGLVLAAFDELEGLAEPELCPRADPKGPVYRVQPCGFACRSPLSKNKRPRCGKTAPAPQS